MVADAVILKDLNFGMLMGLMIDVLGHAASCGGVTVAILCLHRNGQELAQGLRGKC